MLHCTFSPMHPAQVRAVAAFVDIVCLLMTRGDSALEVSTSVFSINASSCCKLVLQDCMCLVNSQSSHSYFCFSKDDHTKVIFSILVTAVLWLFVVVNDRTVR